MMQPKRQKSKVNSAKQEKGVDLERVRVVADELEGTCKSLADATTEAERGNLSFLVALDDIVLECGLCGWWSEVSEFELVGDEEICADCRQ
jgi:hypothetical protein